MSDGRRDPDAAHAEFVDELAGDVRTGLLSMDEAAWLSREQVMSVIRFACGFGPPTQTWMSAAELVVKQGGCRREARSPATSVAIHDC